MAGMLFAMSVRVLTFFAWYLEHISGWEGTMGKAVRSCVVLSILALVISLAPIPTLAGTVEVEIFGPEVFSRDAGASQAAIRNFTVTDLSASTFLLKVDNGSVEEGGQVSSAVVVLNGTTILKQNDFNQNIYFLEEPVSLLATNELEVRVNSIPSSYITITIVGNYDDPGASDDDGDGYSENAGDCNDTDPSIYPGAAEICDGIDNNCDGANDEGVTATFYLDSDTDGYGIATETVEACTAPSGYAAQANDCNDSDATINPSASEICNGVDDNCDASIDEGFDVDGDGYTSCGGDCNDLDAAISPSASEICDGVDNNCNSQVDEGVTSTFYLDADGDGYGSNQDTTEACSAPAGYTSTPNDCDDTDAGINPAAAEVCDQADNNCDGQVDEGFDADSDGYTTCDGDCDDNDATTYPGAAEICDGIDNNCDGTTDSGCLTGIIIDPATFILTTSSPTQQLLVIGYYADNTSSDITAASEGTTYTSSDTSVATVSLGGLVSYVDAGSATITALNGGFSSVADFTVQLLPATYEEQAEGTFGDFYEDLVPPDITIDHYDEERFSLITGLVENINGAPISDVKVTIFNHPEYGSVLTDSTGRYTIPVEGEGSMNVNLEKFGLIPLHRKVEVLWNDIAVADKAVMIARDTVSTQVVFNGDPGTTYTHRSTPIVDEYGSRTLTMVISGDNHAYTFNSSGNQVFFPVINVRGTEFPTPESMPAQLPPTSAFTWCAEVEADEAEDLYFEKAIDIYVENFLGFDVGYEIPVGFYERDLAAWVPDKNGVIVMLLDTDSDGIVDALDADGDMIADDLNNNGNIHDEVNGLTDPASFMPGDTLMRAEITHFSTVDLNAPWGPASILGAIEAAVDFYLGLPWLDFFGFGQDSDCNGSYTERRSRAVHEDIPVLGTGMTLHYSSKRTSGYKMKVSIPVSRDSIPDDVKTLIARVRVGGRMFEQAIEPTPNQVLDFEWDGLDALGREVSYPVKVAANVGWSYDAYYYRPGPRLESFAMPGTEPTWVSARENEIIAWRETMLEDTKEGRGTIAEGWTLSPHHQLDPSSPNTLIKGDGSVLKYAAAIADRFAGTGQTGHPTDGIPAVEDRVWYPHGVEVDGQGNVYIAELSMGNGYLRKVDKEGIITTFATVPGTWYLAPDKLGNIYLTLRDSHRLKRVAPDGTVTDLGGFDTPHQIDTDNDGNVYFTIGFFGSLGINKYYPDGDVETINPPVGSNNSIKDVAVDGEGNIFYINHTQVRKLDTAGVSIVIAGKMNLSYPYSGEGGLATDAVFDPIALDVDPEGNLYILHQANNSDARILKVDRGGTITTIAGGVSGSQGGDGAPASRSSMHTATDLAVDVDGSIYVTFNAGNKVAKISPNGAFETLIGEDETGFAEGSGLGYVMDVSGRHDRTIDLLTGKTLLDFDYISSAAWPRGWKLVSRDGSTSKVFDPGYRISSIADQFGNTTTIQWDGEIPVSITSPDGLVTQLNVDGNNHLKSVTFPDSTGYNFDYTSGGLMTDAFDPNGNKFTHVYDADGRITDVLDPVGGHWTYDQWMDPDGNITSTLQTAEGNVTTHVDLSEVSGATSSSTFAPNGSVSTTDTSTDGLTSTTQTSCGMEISATRGLDLKYLFEVTESSAVIMPSGLSVTSSSDRVYSDSDVDGIDDTVTDTVTVNGKTTTVANNTLTGTLTTTSPEGRQAVSTYDTHTQLTSKVSTPGLFDTDFVYDARGRLETTTVGTRTTTFAYDTNGHMDYVITSDNKTFDYTYDQMGRLIGESRPDNTQVSYGHDDNGNLTVIINPRNISHGFTYTDVDQRETYDTPASGSYSYSYDQDRRLKSVTYPSGQQVNNIWADGELTLTSTPEGAVSYSYDCGGKLKSVTKSGEGVSYTYDGSLLLTDTRVGTIRQTITYGYNADLQVDNITYAGVTDSFNYDDDGLLTNAGPYTIARDVANGLPESVSDGTVTQDRSFSMYGEVDGVDYTVGAKVAYSWAVSRDNAGRITRKVENIGTDTVTWDYTYDQMSRLVTVYKDNNMAEAYSYDEQGNRLSETNLLRSVSRTYTHDDEDKIVWAEGGSYQYDVDGFLTTRSIASGANSGTTAFDYSSQGELLSATLPNGSVISYKYDQMGRRIAKSVDLTIVEKYLWLDATTLAAVLDSADNVVQRFEYADNSLPITMTSGSQVYYLAYDQIGSLRAIIDSVGTVIKQITYDSFGNVLSETNPSLSLPFGFAGGLHDYDIGLVRYGARDYDSAVGRWTAKDPILFSGGDLNLYNYCLGDPINLSDPSGLQAAYEPADLAPEISAPGEKEYFIPVWGSGRAAMHNLQNGQWVRATFNGAMAVSDIFLIKTIATGVSKGALKLGSSNTWPATRAWLRKNGQAAYGQPMHHWLVPQGTWGTKVPEWLKNQPWNLMGMPSTQFHNLLHGAYGEFGKLEKIWYGSPGWAKALLGSGFGRLFGFDPCP
jgi:RHS repeat-associated protein